MVDALDDDWWETDVVTGSANSDDEAEAHSEEVSNSTVKKRKFEETSERDAVHIKKKKKKGGQKAKTSSTSESSTKSDKLNSGAKILSDATVEAEDDGRPKPAKKKRKTITDVLAVEQAKALTYEDFIGAVKKHYKDKLTALEWDEITLQESDFTLCNDLSHTPNSYFKAVLPKWKKLKSKMSAQPGSPLVLVVCSAAIRAANMTRLISDFKGEDCKIAKLFAKHFKLEEQIKFLQKSSIHIGIGTPNRIHSLLDNGCLKLSQLECIILDWSWRDCKQKKLIDIPQIKIDLFNLFKGHIIPAVKKNKTRIGLF